MRHMIIVALLFCGSQVFCGQFNVQINGVYLEGYVISTDDNTIKYTYSRVFKEDPEYNIVVIEEKQQGDNETIRLLPTTAQSIVGEAEPYLMLHERGRKVSEIIKINDTISIGIEGGEQFSICIMDTSKATKVLLRDDNATDFIRNMKEAEHISQGWFYSYFNNAFAEQQQKENLSQQSIDKEGFLDLSTMDADYSANEVAANKKYEQFIGKKVKITATMGNVTAGNIFIKGTTIRFKESVGFMPITCLLANDVSAEEVAALQPGQQITVEGIWQGKPQFMKPTLTDARIIK